MGIEQALTNYIDGISTWDNLVGKYGQWELFPNGTIILWCADNRTMANLFSAKHSLDTTEKMHYKDIRDSKLDMIKFFIGG